VAPDPRDLDLRQRALEHVRVLSRRYDDIVPVDVLRMGFDTPRGRISYGSFFNGIFRPREFGGPAALSLVTAPPKERRDARTTTTSTRRPGPSRDRPDPDRLRARFERFRAVA
jgi:hypothetical protein